MNDFDSEFKRFLNELRLENNGKDLDIISEDAVTRLAERLLRLSVMEFRILTLAVMRACEWYAEGGREKDSDS